MIMFPNFFLFDLHVPIFLSISPFLDLSRCLGERWNRRRERELNLGYVLGFFNLFRAFFSTFSWINFPIGRTKRVVVSALRTNMSMKDEVWALFSMFLSCMSSNTFSPKNERICSSVRRSRTWNQSRMRPKVCLPHFSRIIYPFWARRCALLPPGDLSNLCAEFADGLKTAKETPVQVSYHVPGWTMGLRCLTLRCRPRYQSIRAPSVLVGGR